MITTQIKILNKLVNIVNNSTDEVYDTAHLEYKFNPDEGWRSLTIWYVKDSKNFSSQNFDSISPEVRLICQELHSEMQSHTGGDWRKFILTIDENREAKTQFIYEVQSCMDDIEELF